jgi:hypothetical protein
MIRSTRVSSQAASAMRYLTDVAEAAEDLRKNRAGFIANVKNSMNGGYVKGESFDRVLV